MFGQVKQKASKGKDAQLQDTRAGGLYERTLLLGSSLFLRFSGETERTPTISRVQQIYTFISWIFGSLRCPPFREHSNTWFHARSNLATCRGGIPFASSLKPIHLVACLASDCIGSWKLDSSPLFTLSVTSLHACSTPFGPWNQRDVDCQSGWRQSWLHR